MTVASTEGEQQNKTPRRWITIKAAYKVFQECTLVILDLLSFLRHLALVFQCTLDERGDPFLDDISVLLGCVTERFKERPESTPDAPLERNPLNFHERVHKGIKSIGTIRQSIKVVSEEELGCRVDREASGQVFEVDRLVGFKVRDVIESLVDVFVEVPEIRCPVVDKEWSRGRSVLHENKRREMRGIFQASLLTAFHISSSRFKIPAPRKVSLTSLHDIVTRKDRDALTVALSGYPRERSLCDRSPART